MKETVVVVAQGERVTFGGASLALDDAAGLAWRKAVQSLHPRLLPNLKESALIEEEDSAFCVAGGVFEYERGQELVIDGEELKLSHCAEHFLDFLLPPGECLQIVEEKRAELANVTGTEIDRERWEQLVAWWEQGLQVLVLQH